MPAGLHSPGQGVAGAARPRLVGVLVLIINASSALARAESERRQTNPEEHGDSDAAGVAGRVVHVGPARGGSGHRGVGRRPVPGNGPEATKASPPTLAIPRTVLRAVVGRPPTSRCRSSKGGRSRCPGRTGSSRRWWSRPRPQTPGTSAGAGWSPARPARSKPPPARRCTRTARPRCRPPKPPRPRAATGGGRAGEQSASGWRGRGANPVAAAAGRPVQPQARDGTHARQPTGLPFIPDPPSPNTLTSDKENRPHSVAYCAQVAGNRCSEGWWVPGGVRSWAHTHDARNKIYQLWWGCWEPRKCGDSSHASPAPPRHAIFRTGSGAAPGRSRNALVA